MATSGGNGSVGGLVLHRLTSAAVPWASCRLETMWRSSIGGRARPAAEGANEHANERVMLE